MYSQHKGKHYQNQNRENRNIRLRCSVVGAALFFVVAPSIAQTANNSHAPWEGIEAEARTFLGECRQAIPAEHDDCQTRQQSFIRSYVRANALSMTDAMAVGVIFDAPMNDYQRRVFAPGVPPRAVDACLWKLILASYVEPPEVADGAKRLAAVACNPLSPVDKAAVKARFLAFEPLPLSAAPPADWQPALTHRPRPIKRSQTPL